MCASPARQAAGLVDELQTIEQTGLAAVDQVHTIMRTLAVAAGAENHWRSVNPRPSARYPFP
jgi:hypothetical protein